MTSYPFLAGVMLLTVAMVTTALPQAANAKDRRVTASQSSQDGRANEEARQLGSSSAAIASSGLVNGAANSPGIQSPALAQQLQTALQSDPSGAMAELNAQKEETVALQVQKQQQAVLAAIQAQQQQLAAAQYALAGHRTPGNAMFSPSTSSNPAALQVQQQLLEQQQKLKLQQELLQKQQNPNTALGLNQQSILMTQLLSSPNVANRPQLLEQIRQQQNKQQADRVFYQSNYPSSDLSAFSPGLSMTVPQNRFDGFANVQTNPMLSMMTMSQPAAIMAALQQQLMLRQLLLRQQQMALLASRYY